MGPSKDIKPTRDANSLAPERQLSTLDKPSQHTQVIGDQKVTAHINHGKVIDRVQALANQTMGDLRKEFSHTDNSFEGEDFDYEPVRRQLGKAKDSGVRDTYRGYQVLISKIFPRQAEVVTAQEWRNALNQ